MISSEEFLLHLRSALNHLYDPYFLQKSPLVRLLHLGDQPDTPSALQRILNEAIGSLEPAPGDTNRTEKQRNYELIMYRYVQQFGQEEVANQLGLSVRHLRRQQNAAVYSLGAYLWEKYQLGSRPFSGNVEGTIDEGQTEIDEGESSSELEWLKDVQLEEPASLMQMLPAVIAISLPLAQKHAVQLNFHLAEDLPRVAVHPMALRQILLNMLSVAIPLSPNGRIDISAESYQHQIQVRILCSQPAGSCRPHCRDKADSIQLAEKMLKLYRGSIRCASEEEPFWATLLMPEFVQIKILVIDDNPDYIQLIQRNTTGTLYQVTGEQNPEHGLALAEEMMPDIIILDVMMPRVDGWDILSRLLRHPITSQIPVIVSTILAQEELALSLGASAFLRKPVTREQVLAVLDQLSGIQELKSH